MNAAPPSPLEYMDVDTDIAPTRKRPREDRCEIRTQAADLLTPRYTGQSNQYVESLDWISTNTGEVKRSQRVEDEKDTRAMIISIHRGNPVRAATSIRRFLSNPSNKEVNDKVTAFMSEEQSQESRANSLILGGIHQSIDHHTTARGARTLLHEMFVKFVVVACMFKIVMDGTNIPD